MAELAPTNLRREPRALTGVVARARSEAGVVQIGAAVIAVHVADDNFLQPNAGTTASGHVVSGLVPLALVVGAAVAYPRLRPGLRGVTAILLGYLGLLVGVEAVYYARAVGPSGDDFTGLLAIPAGLVLLGVGIRALWRSRKRDGRRPWRYVRRLLLAVGAALVCFLFLFPIALSYVVTHTLRAEVPPPSLGAAHEDVSFTTSDGLRLEGWFVPSRNGATVMVVPGRSGPQRQARLLVSHGYGVLLFDRRGEGASDGDPNVFGWKGERDLHAAAQYLRSRPDVDPGRIGGIGLSVGGEMLIHAAAQSDEFAAVVSEGASGQSVRDDRANHGLVEGILSTGVSTLATAVFTNGLPPPSLRSDVARIAPRALFLIYGEHGQSGSERKPNRLFYEAANAPKAIWEVPDAQHVAGITTRPREYERRVIGFLDRALLDDEGRRNP